MQKLIFPYFSTLNSTTTMRNTLIIAFMALTALSTTGCKKKGNDNSEVTFVNRVSQSVTIDIYRSFSDYANHNNVFLRKIMDANEVAFLPGNTFTTGATYYIDWYSNDYYQTNWYNEKYETDDVYTFRPVPGDNSFYTNNHYRSNARRSFLNITGTSSKWVAVDAYLYSSSTGYVSQWAGMTAAEQFREVTVNKAFQAVYDYRDNNGTLQQSNYEFLVHPSSDQYIELLDANGTSVGNLTGGRLPTSTQPDYASTSLDTVLALLPGNDYTYMMVRQ